eukprot:1997684-Amphidinium_carterae.2
MVRSVRPTVVLLSLRFLTSVLHFNMQQTSFSKIRHSRLRHDACYTSSESPQCLAALAVQLWTTLTLSTGIVSISCCRRASKSHNAKPPTPAMKLQ